MIASLWYPAIDREFHPLYVGIVMGLRDWGIKP